MKNSNAFAGFQRGFMSKHITFLQFIYAFFLGSFTKKNLSKIVVRIDQN